MKVVPEHLKQYIQYIRNTAHVPLAVELFDEDWEPIGLRVRIDLMQHGLIEEHHGGIVVKDDVP